MPQEASFESSQPIPTSSSLCLLFTFEATHTQLPSAGTCCHTITGSYLPGTVRPTLLLFLEWPLVTVCHGN